MGSKLRAFVRYTNSGKVIPGSLILRKRMPTTGRWKEINGDLCCTTLSTGSLTEGPLIIGTTYTITNYVSGDDFSNETAAIEGTVNTDGYTFVASDANPTDWSNGSTLTY